MSEDENQDYCDNCGNPKLYPEKPCPNCSHQKRLSFFDVTGQIGNNSKRKLFIFFLMFVILIPIFFIFYKNYDYLMGIAKYNLGDKKEAIQYFNKVILVNYGIQFK